MNDVKKQVFNLSTDIVTDNLDDEVNDISDTVTKERGCADRQHKLSVVLPPTRSRSPVTVQEWVAALPDHAEEDEDKHEVSDDNEETDECETGSTEDEHETDNLSLGAEAGYIQPQNAAKLLLAGRYKTKNATGQASTSDKRGQFQHSDTAASLRSNLSVLSSSSVDSAVLQSREADPEEVLLNLGFGGSEALSKIPARFLRHKSKAKGITVNSFIAKQEDQLNRFESGYFGYRGLQGCSSRRPSGIVEKILQTLKEREKELRRKNSTISWTSTASFGASAIPSRFRVMNPHRKTFQSVVEQVVQPGPVLVDQQKKFKCVAQSLLGQDNREWREREEEEMEKREGKHLKLCQAKQLEDISEDNDIGELSDCVSSEVSDDSDWSDEEREKFEKIFGAMSERGEECEKIRHLRRSRRRSRRTRESVCPGMSGISSWEVAKLVYSRDSSLSGLTSSSLNSSTLELDSRSLDGRDLSQNNESMKEENVLENKVLCDSSLT